MIAVGFLVSYDYGLLKISLPIVYPYVAKIVLAIDAGRKTLTGAVYGYDEGFTNWVSEFDSSGKISWLEQNFFTEGSSPAQVVIKERNDLLEAMKPANWFIQLDADEYF